ncbi:hypothetical protein JCM19238_1892 [Vibrio ponticus]|nr:hypothetical protein JCM19238_1892 [Vibrio ponticus]
MPAAGIESWGILLASFLLALLATGAPTSYGALGTMLGKRISSNKVLFVFNKLMALLLLYVAVTIAWEHIL